MFAIGLARSGLWRNTAKDIYSVAVYQFKKYRNEHHLPCVQQTLRFITSNSESNPPTPSQKTGPGRPKFKATLKESKRKKKAKVKAKKKNKTKAYKEEPAPTDDTGQKKFRSPRSDRTNFEVISAVARDIEIAEPFRPSPLPRLPDLPTEYPTPHITDSDIVTYLIPLYSYGWGVALEQHPEIETYRTGITPMRQHGLIRRYTFATFSASMAFVRDTAEICKSENHHPTITLAGRRVYITSLTHSGLRIASIQQAMPGPTIRDVRLAMLIEGMFRNKFKPRDRELNLMLPQEQRPASLDEIYGGLGNQSTQASEMKWTPFIIRPQSTLESTLEIADDHPVTTSS